MKTLYIDVYFLINFTVDLLAIYFAACFCRVNIKAVRIVIAAAVGALYSVFATLFIYNEGVVLLFSFVFLVVMATVCSLGIGMGRRLRFIFLLFVFQILIGGAVYFSYSVLDRLVGVSELEELKSGNRRFLILAVIILFSIGLIKLLIALFSSVRAERIVSVTIEYKGRAITVDAFVDSGNLAVDPMDRTPVMLLKSENGRALFGEDLPRLVSPLNESYDIKKRVRIIPAKYGEKNILYGVRPDGFYLNDEGRRNVVNMLVAIDDSNGSFGGCCALLPASVLDN